MLWALKRTGRWSIQMITDSHHEACLVMTKGVREGWIFLSHPHTNYGFFFLLTTIYLILYWKKTRNKLPENPEYAEIWHDVILTLQWCPGSRCGKFFIFPMGWYGVCEINRIHHWCSVGTEQSQTEGPPFQWETRLAEFPTERWTRGLGFFWNHWTPMIDSFSHIPRPYGTVLCNICWWRHWGRCLQSMTRAV